MRVRRHKTGTLVPFMDSLCGALDLVCSWDALDLVSEWAALRITIVYQARVWRPLG